MSINLITRTEAQFTAGIRAESTWFRFVKEKLQCGGIRLAKNTVRYVESEVEAIKAARVAGYSDEQVKSLVLSLETQRSESANELLANLNITH
ncbi:MAG: hypothetical protein HRT52_22245 [Colwellia sp.]|nr:hypothetical protein [Colwellia sp.]